MNEHGPKQTYQIQHLLCQTMKSTQSTSIQSQHQDDYYREKTISSVAGLEIFVVGVKTKRRQQPRARAATDFVVIMRHE